MKIAARKLFALKKMKLKGTNFLVFENFSKTTASIRKEKWKEVLKNRKNGKISYLQYKTRKGRFRIYRFIDFERLLNNDSQDPDENFFNAFNLKDSQSLLPKSPHRNLNYFDKGTFSMLHLNIKNLQKNFDSVFNLLMTLKSEFKVICITETWCSDNSMNHKLFKLPQYKSIHQVRRTGKDISSRVLNI